MSLNKQKHKFWEKIKKLFRFQKKDSNEKKLKRLWGGFKIGTKSEVKDKNLLPGIRSFQYFRFVQFLRKRSFLVTSGVFLLVLVGGIIFISNRPEPAKAGGNPTIGSISPNVGITTGGGEVTINGTNFLKNVYRAPIVLANSGSTITNYEGNVSINTASLVSAGKLRSDCGDLRLKDSNGSTDLNYWIDGNCNTTNTIVWFKVPSVANGNKTIYIYYGDSSLTSQSNLSNFSFGTSLSLSSNKLWLSGNNSVGGSLVNLTFTNLDGVTVSGNDVTNTTANNSWSAGLTSNESFASGSGYVSARMEETNSYRMFGLSKGNTDSNYNDIDFAIFPDISGNINVYEGGAGIGTYGTYATNDVLSVEALNNKILYKKNGVTIYTSAVTLTAANYPLALDTSFYTLNSTFKDLKMCTGACDYSSLSTWTDRSGNSNTFSQSTVGFAPYIKASAVDGKPAIVFDGVDDRLSGDTLASVFTGNGSPFSVFSVNKQTAANFGTPWSAGHGTTANRIRSSRFTSATQHTLTNRNDAGTAPTTNVVNSVVQPTNFAVKSDVSTGTSFIYYGNGTAVNTWNTVQTGTTTINKVTLGALGQNTFSQFFAGEMSEVLVFNSALSTTDRQSIENYLNQKYKIYSQTVTHTVNTEEAFNLTVSFGGNAVVNPTFVSSTQLRVLVPASTLLGNKTGSVNVVVTNADGTSVTITGGFTYAAPTISSVSPNSGAVVGGSTVTINGSNFFGGALSRPITVNNPGSTITNYEGNITVDTKALITANKMRSDCGDIRVKDTDGNTDLNYWIDGDCNSVNTVVWYKKASLPAGNSTLYLKYGVPSQTSQSNLANFSFGPVLASTNNKLWLSANSGAGTSTDGTAIQTWNDRTSNGNNATQANSTLRPILKNNIQNGKPVMRFDGVDDKLSLASPSFTANSIFAVMNYTSGSVFSGYPAPVGFQAGAYPFIGSPGSTNFYTGDTRYINGTASQNFSPLGTIKVVTTETSYAVTQVDIAYSQNNNGYWGGDIPEVIVFNSTLSSTDRQIVEGYLNSKYNLFGTNATNTLGSEAGNAGNLTVFFGANAATGVNVLSTTQIQAVAPASTTGLGSVNVVVTNPDAVSATLTNGYTYAAPVVSSVTPNTGPNAGGTFVTVSGNNFSNVGVQTRVITVNNSGSTITNYEGNIVLDTQSAIVGGKMRSDCGDIRVKDTNETTDLNYWIDGDCNSSNTVVWYKKASLPAGNTTLFLKYGVPAQTSQSNLANFSFGTVLSASSNKVWLSANSGTGSTADSSLVQTWTDRTSNGNNATQATSGNRPKRISSAINNLPSLRFDVTNTRMGLSFNTAGNTGFTFFTTAKSTNAGQGVLLSSGVNATSGVRWALAQDLSGSSQGFGWAGPTSNVNLGTDTNGGVNSLRSYVKNGTGWTVYRNGNSVSTPADTSTPSGTWNGAIGSESVSSQLYAFGGDLSELLVFNTALNSTDRGLVETYINTKYRLYNTSTLPTNTLGTEYSVNVKIGGADLTNITFVNSQTITGYVIAGTGVKNAIVTNPDGTSSNTLNTAYTYGGTAVPNPIIDLSATYDGGSASLTWTAPFDNGSAISDYIIKYSQNNFSSETIVSDGVNTNTSYTITGLTPGQNYQFKVLARNSVGDSVSSNIVSVTSLDCDQDFGGADFTPTNGFTLDKRYCNINNFNITTGFTVNTAQGVKVRVYATNSNIAGTLNANSNGFSGLAVNGQDGQGPGAGLYSGGTYAGGAGYGGNGGNSRNGGVDRGSSYGSIVNPVDLGSSGGGRPGPTFGGNGGGAIKLTVTNTLTVAGSITANGQNSADQYAGGGSGGSIWITTGSFAGSGSITTNGGNGGSNGGGGGSGGRIALFYQSKSYTGTTTSTGGTGGIAAQAGGAGTVYEKLSSDSFATLIINNGNIAGTNIASTPINSSNLTDNTLKQLTLTNKAQVTVDKNITINNSLLDINAGTYVYANNTITVTGLQSGTGTAIAGTLDIKNNISGNLGALSIASTGIITTNQNTTTQAYKLDITADSINISSGGKIDVNNDGFSGLAVNGQDGQGPGAGLYSGGTYAGGAGYGGNGGNSRNGGVDRGSSYGSIVNPVDLGSSGGGRPGPTFGGNGGGAIKLTVTNTLTVAGSITANGQNSADQYAGGGSGGSIWITTGSFAGSGSITTNGGNGGSNGGGGGSGGRIALFYQSKSYTGTTTSTGGTGGIAAQAGGAGTVYEKLSSDSFATLIINNGNIAGTNIASTPINSSNLTDNTLKQLTLTNKAQVTVDKNITINNSLLDINAGTYVYANNTITVTGLQSGTGTAIAGTLDIKNNISGNLGALSIASTGIITTNQNTTTQAYKLDITADSINISSGGKIDVNNDGFSGLAVNGQDGQGPGAGLYSGGTYAGGAGYGGNGGNSRNGGPDSGSSYGSIVNPVDLGSSGGGRQGPTFGGNGGGAIKLTVTNALTVAGSITANGQNSADQYAGGGSGGSIWITTGSFAGSGSITTNGGNGGSNGGGGGSGGRIALFYQSKSYTGTTTSTGGTGGIAAQAGGAGTIYEPNTPQTNLTSATFSPNPNPVSVGSTYTVQITNVRNTFGFNLYTGTCSVTITGPSGYNENRTGTVNTGICTTTGSFPDPVNTGTYTASVSVTGTNTQTTNPNLSFTVYSSASNRAKVNTGSLPVYSTLLASPTPTLIGSTFTITATGFVDSGNDQALNGIPCAFNVTGPSAFSQTFNSTNLVGGSCTYNFNANDIPNNPGTYSVTTTVQGASINLTTTSVDFNRYFDVYLTNGGGFDFSGKIPGETISSTPTIDLNNPSNPVFTSPIIKKQDNVTLLTQGTACAILIKIGNGVESSYNSTINSSGQCSYAVPIANFSAGTLSLRAKVTLLGVDFYTNYATNPPNIANFPSNLAKADTGNPTQPQFTAQTATPSPTFIGQNYTLSITGLYDSIQTTTLLTGTTCTFVITGPSSYSSNQTSSVSGGNCSVNLSGNLPTVAGQYSFKVQVNGESGVLETSTVNFNRFFNIKLTGGTPGISGSINGATTSSATPIIVNQGTTLTSPVIRNYVDNANLSGNSCRNVFKLNSNADIFYTATLNGSGQCVTAVPLGDVTTTGTAYVKTQVSVVNSDFDSSYTFETTNNPIQIKQAPTAQICANPTFRDDNKNGSQDGAEPLLAGVVTRLKDSANSTVLNTLTTSISGGSANCFTSLFDETYYIEQVLPSGSTLQTSNSSYQVILGVGQTANRAFGYNGDAQICANPTFIDTDSNGIYNSGLGDYYLAGVVTNLYLTSNLATSLQQITSTNTGPNCFTAVNPGNYTVIQTAPNGTTSTTGTINLGKVSNPITLAFGTNQNTSFGYHYTPSNKAKPQDSPNETKPVYSSIIQLTTVNPTYNERAFVNYPVSATISGLLDSATDQPLVGTGICSATFSGPSFASPITVSNLNVVAGECIVNNTNNSTVLPTSVASGNGVVFNVNGPSSTLTSDSHSFEVFSGNSTICPVAFADYNLDGIKDSNEVYLSGIQTELFNGPTLLETINSNIAGTSCFASRASGINYTITQTAPSGAILTTGSLSRNINPFPETTNNSLFAYRGNSSLTAKAFRDDNRNGVNNSEPAISGSFKATLKDYAGNTIQSDLTIDNTTSFANLLSTAVMGGNYRIDVDIQGLSVTNTTNNNPASAITLSSGTNADVDFGFASDSEVCPNPSFYDYNNNGNFDSGEALINGLATRLLRASDSSEVATLVTSNTNCFSNVVPGNYIIEQTHTTGAVLTTTPGTQASGKVTIPVTSLLGVDQSNKFGYRGNNTVCPNPTFQDNTNKDGVQDPGEPSINGLTTVLKDSFGNTIQSLVTNGTNCFTNLLGGNYQVIQTPPSNSVSTTGGTTKNITLADVEDKVVPFGYNGDPLVCPVAFRDDNSNTTFDNTENDLSGVSFVLKDNGGIPIGSPLVSNGTSQCFPTELSIGQNYSVTATLPSGYTATTTLVSNITSSFGQRYTPNFGFNGNGQICVLHTFRDVANIGNFDSGEQAISGVTTRLRNVGSNTDLQTFNTDTNGQGCFTSITPGQYLVLQDAPVGTSTTTGGNIVSTLGVGETKNLNFGYEGSGTICVDLYDDLNFNARKDSGENKISAITTELYFQSNLVTPISTQNTNGSTDICYTGLYPEDYQIKVLTTGYLVGASYTSSTGGDTQNVTLNVGNSYYSTIKFGYTNNPDWYKGAFRGLVYVDRNENDQYNTKGTDLVEATVYDNDVPLVEKLVTLYKDSGGSNFVEVSNQLSDSIGEFNFLGLDPGDYKVVITNDTGLIAVTPASAVSPTSSTRFLTIATNEKRYDIYGFQYTSQICPNIFVDKNNDNIFNGTDVNLITTNGVYVQLKYQSFGGEQTFGNYSPNGLLLNSSNPCITKVPPRNYDLVISNYNFDTANPIKFDNSFDTAFYTLRSPALPTNPNTSIFLGNTTNPTVRYYTNAIYTLSSITGKFYHDRPDGTSFDANGDDNKTGVENISGKNYDRDYDNDFLYTNKSLSLRKCGPMPGETQGEVDAWNASMPTTSTDSNGDYTFGNIPTGAYTVIQNDTLPYQSIMTGGLSGSCLGGQNYVFFNSLYFNNTLVGTAPGSTYQNDIRWQYTTAIRGKLWIDSNKNGVKDSFEDQERYYATFEIANANGIVDVTPPNPIRNLINSYVGRITPDNYTSTLLVDPANSTVPSDYSIVGSVIQPFSTFSGSSVLLEYGMDPTTNSSISGKVFVDRNENNVYEPNGEDGLLATTFDNDQILPGTLVKLYHGGAVNPLTFKTSVVADSNGDYQFNNLAEGIYVVESVGSGPSGSVCNPAECSNQVNLLKDTNETQNMRYNYNGKLRLTSFYDTIENFTRDSDWEVDVNNFSQGFYEETYTLIAPDGTQVSTTQNVCILDPGCNQYTKLAPGNYTVQINNLPSSLRGYSTPDTISIAPSQSQARDYPFEAKTNNTIQGDVFIDKQGLNGGFNGEFDVNGFDTLPATLFDNDEPLLNNQVTIRGPLGTYTTNTGGNKNYQFTGLPSGKYVLNKYVSGNQVSLPNIEIGVSNAALPEIVLQSYSGNANLYNANTRTNNFSYRYTNSISAYCYEDKDQNGQITYYPDSDTYDRRTSGCLFELVNSNTGEIIPMSVSAAGASDANGTYAYELYSRSFVPPGSYTLRNINDVNTTTVTNLSKYTPSVNNYGPVRQNTFTFSTNNLNQSVGYYMFINFQPTTNNASIIGQVFVDKNGNTILNPTGTDTNPATKEDNDYPLKGVWLTLTGTGSNVGVNRTTQTDATGNYQITDLPAGPFTLNADLIQK